QRHAPGELLDELDRTGRRTLLEIERLPKLGCRHPADINIGAGIETPGGVEWADYDGVEAGVAHQALGRRHGGGIVAGDRYADEVAFTVCLLSNHHETHRVERAYQADAGQIFRGSNARAAL